MRQLHGNLHIEYMPFDFATVSNDRDMLNKLAEFYCSIWMYDPNFGEFTVCPVCGKYFNEKTSKTVKFCSGNKNEHPLTALVPAWEPDEVSQMILDKTKEYGDNFYGVYAIDLDSNKIIGFTWGWLETLEKIQEEWGFSISEMLGNIDSTYYSEIAVDPDEKYREKRIGKTLCSLLTMWMSTAYPDVPSFLRTHKTSRAKKMFEEAGYVYFAEDPQHGDGRIMLKVNQGRDLIP